MPKQSNSISIDCSTPNGTGANLPPSLESVEVSAPHEVTMNLSTPAGDLSPRCAVDEVMMMSPTAVTQYAKTDPFKASVGTGPYKFEEYKTGSVHQARPQRRLLG